MPTCFFFFFLLTFFLIYPPVISSPSSKSNHRRPHHHHHRRILHQPLFPFESLPPTTQPPVTSPQPQPQQQPKYPFSSFSPPTKGNPFFPFYPSPPPPPPPSASLATFPANISSLVLPQSSSKPISRRLVAIAASLSLISVVLVVSVVAFVLYHRRHQSFTDKKALRTDSIRLFPPNTAASDGGHKPTRNVSSTSSEFLYLGTLRGIDEDGRQAGNSSNAGASSMPAYQKLGSPELRPLPPLPRQNFRQNYSNAEFDSNRDNEEEEDEFFSPRSSSVEKGSPPPGPGSCSPRVFLGVEAENLGGGSSDSGTASLCPSSNSVSPSISMSSSPFIALNLSPRSFGSKSPDSVVGFPAPSRPPPAIPPQNGKTSSPSPPSTPQKRNSGPTQNSPARDSDVPEQIQQHPSSCEMVSEKYVPPMKSHPPPPPPLPPPGFWEIPFAPTSFNREGPPVLVTPTRPVVFQNPESVSSPLEPAPQNLETMDRSGETPKPKLKPLHWDKVRASSNRAMVWDQLKSSSFQ
ncbi:hypothetical protein U1Q18_031488 [Sarracenia purpurea var. burkii]